MKKIKIKYDFQIFNSQKYGGISKYFVYLYINIKNLGLNPNIVVPIYRNKYLSNLNRNNYFNFYLNTENQFINRILKVVSFLFDFIHSKFHKYDIVHKTYFASKINLFGFQFLLSSFSSAKSKNVITFYDMSYLLFPKLLKNSKNIVALQKEQCAKADLIISISESTKNDLIKYFNIDQNKIKVIHLGVDQEVFFKANNEYCVHYNNFILYVGSRDGYKNFDIFLRSFSNLKAHNINLVVFGGSNFNIKEINLINSLNILEKVFYLDGDEKLLAKLYNSAKMFVYPSLYEGFGLPILEAMSCGCPVIAGKNSSIVEVAGNAAKLIDTNDTEVLTNSMDEILENDELKLSLINLGLKRSKQFSWEKCALDTIEAYERLLAK